MGGSSDILRVDFADNPSVSDLLVRVQKIVSEAYRYQEFPRSQIETFRHSSENFYYRSCEIVFLLHYYETSQPLLLPNLNSRYLNICHDNDDVSLPLLLSMYVKSRKLYGSFVYRNDKLNDETILRMEADFIALLGMMVLEI